MEHESHPRQANPAELLVREVRQVSSLQFHGPRRRPIDDAHDVEQGGLPSTGYPDADEELSLGHSHADAVENPRGRDRRGISLGQVRALKHGRPRS